MRRPRLLDLFCGAGGAAMGYHRAGFDVVGVDIVDQPSYPFEFRKESALVTSFKGFDAIHASPPCQRYSRISRYQRVASKYEDLIDVTRIILQASGLPYVIENVPEAPLRNDLTLCGQMFGLPILRHRIFEVSGFDPAHPAHPARPSWSGWNVLPDILTIVGHTYRFSEGKLAMGMPWVRNREELNEAIPPDYTELIGKMLISQLLDADPT